MGNTLAIASQQTTAALEGGRPVFAGQGLLQPVAVGRAVLGANRFDPIGREAEIGQALVAQAVQVGSDVCLAMGFLRLDDAIEEPAQEPGLGSCIGAVEAK